MSLVRSNKTYVNDGSKVTPAKKDNSLLNTPLVDLLAKAIKSLAPSTGEVDPPIYYVAPTTKTTLGTTIPKLNNGYNGYTPLMNAMNTYLQTQRPTPAKAKATAKVTTTPTPAPKTTTTAKVTTNPTPAQQQNTGASARPTSVTPSATAGGQVGSGAIDRLFEVLIGSSQATPQADLGGAGYGGTYNQQAQALESLLASIQAQQEQAQRAYEEQLRAQREYLD